jgi:hypothetical protein
MKVKVRKNENFVELNFPCYIKSKSGYHLYKLKSENEIIQIFEGAYPNQNYFHSSIMNVRMEIALIDGWEFTTEKEYWLMLAKIFKSFEV